MIIIRIAEVDFILLMNTHALTPLSEFVQNPIESLLMGRYLVCQTLLCWSLFGQFYQQKVLYTIHKE